MKAPQPSRAADLAKTHVFWDLDHDELHALAEIAVEHPFKAGEVIIRAGDTDCGLVVITRGHARVETSKGQLITEVGEGAVVGEIALFDQQPRSASIVAKTNCSTVQFSSLDLWLLLDKNPRLAAKVLYNLGRVMSARLRSATPG